MKFNELPIGEEILKSIDEMGYTEPSPIQEKAIPPITAAKDVVGIAQTGTGKTAAFAIPILQLLSYEKKNYHKTIKCLILTPTRELAIQIHENFELYGKYLRLKTAVIYGGVGQNPQIEKLKKGVDILIATPGRLNDLHNQGYIDLSGVEIFVLDEADRMLDMGFVHDVKRVIKRIPAQRQTLLFSATMPKEIQYLVVSLLTDPVYVEVTPAAKTAELVEQEIYKVDKHNKTKLLTYLLRAKSIEQALVFTRTKHGADRVVKELARQGITALAIHGNKSQGARQTALNAFKSGEVKLLIATDIAARGIDISELPFVINYDLPNIPETYVHRIGRTGRAGLSGKSISFSTFEELEYLKDIEHLIGMDVPVEDKHPYPMEVFEIPPKNTQQRVKRGDKPKQSAPSEKKSEGSKKSEGTKRTDAPKKKYPPKKSSSDKSAKPKKQYGEKQYGQKKSAPKSRNSTGGRSHK